jgi:hypothetical protein
MLLLWKPLNVITYNVMKHETCYETVCDDPIPNKLYKSNVGMIMLTYVDCNDSE